MPEPLQPPRHRYRQTATGWALIGAGVLFAVEHAMTLRPWLAGVALGLLVAFAGGVFVADAGDDGRDR